MEIVEKTGDVSTCPWDQCDEAVKNQQMLKRHLLASHGKLQYRCVRCKATFSMNQNPSAREKHVCQTQMTDFFSSSTRTPDEPNVATEESGLPRPKFSASSAAPSSGAPSAFEASKRQCVSHSITLRYEAGEACNAFGFMRSSALENLAQNAHVVVEHVDGLPVLCVEALYDMPEHTELICDWDETNLHYLLRATVFAQASRTHSMHIRRRMLESLYDMYDLKRPILRPTLPVEKVPEVLWMRYLDKESLNLWEYIEASKKFTKGPIFDEALPVISAETAFVESECTLIARTEASHEAKALLNGARLNDKPPDWKVVFSDKLRATHELMYQIECPNVEIRRIDYLYHPVRFLNPPGKSQYGIFARVHFSEGAPIVCYKGEVITQREYDKMASPQYSFDFGLEFSLHINADDNGNEGRYVNDCFGRNWDPNKADEDVANAHYLVCWDENHNIPALFIVAKKPIARGEEIVVDYGKLYWNPLMHELGRRHAREFCKTMQICKQLEEDLLAKRIPLPPELHWPALATHPEGQKYRPLPVGAMVEEGGSDGELPEHVEAEIEELVDKRVMPFGVQYLVKWAKYDWAHNTWAHEADLPDNLVQQFEMSLLAKSGVRRELRRSRGVGGGSGSGANKLWQSSGNNSSNNSSNGNNNNNKKTK